MYILIVLYFGNTIQYFSDNVSLKYSACFAINVRNYLHWFRHICILFVRPTKKKETDVLQGETFKCSLKLLLGAKSYRWDVNQPIVFCLKAAASKGTPTKLHPSVFLLVLTQWVNLGGDCCQEHTLWQQHSYSQKKEWRLEKEEMGEKCSHCICFAPL